MNEFSFTITIDDDRVSSLEEAEAVARRFLRDEAQVSIASIEVEKIETTRWGDTSRRFVAGRRTLTGYAALRS